MNDYNLKDFIKIIKKKAFMGKKVIKKVDGKKILIDKPKNFIETSDEYEVESVLQGWDLPDKDYVHSYVDFKIADLYESKNCSSSLLYSVGSVVDNSVVFFKDGLLMNKGWKLNSIYLFTSDKKYQFDKNIVLHMSSFSLIDNNICDFVLPESQLEKTGEKVDYQFDKDEIITFKWCCVNEQNDNKEVFVLEILCENN